MRDPAAISLTAVPQTSEDGPDCGTSSGPASGSGRPDAQNTARQPPHAVLPPADGPGLQFFSIRPPAFGS